MAGVHYPTNAGQAWARGEAIGVDGLPGTEVPILLKSVVQWTDWAQCMVCQYEDQQKIADRKNCRQSIFLSHYDRVHACEQHHYSPHHLGKHEEKLATLEIMFRAIRTRKIWPFASPRVVPKSVPNP